MDRANVLIIGGGVVGCAVAEALGGRGWDGFVVEECAELGMDMCARA
jgi:L-2-hydroxyglutarate oxidase LhgO